MSTTINRRGAAFTTAAASAKDAVPAVLRASQILDTLAAAREPMGLADLTRVLELPKSSVLGLCNTLVSVGLATRHADGRFGLGVHLVELAHAYLARVDITQEFNAAWDSMHVLPKEGVVLAVLDGTDVVYVACRHSEMPLGVAYRIGMRLPASCTATGKALLATFSDERVRELYRNTKLAKVTPHSYTSLKKLLENLAIVRKVGFAVDDEETREGMMCIGAPVFDASRGQAIAAVALSTLKYPHDPEKLQLASEAIREFASVLSTRLGAIGKLG